MTVQVVGVLRSRRRRRSACSPRRRRRAELVPVGRRTLPNGRYNLIVTAQPPGTQSVSQSVALIVDRTLSSLTAGPSTFSPNGDGVNDTIDVRLHARPAHAGPGGRSARRRRRRDGLRGAARRGHAVDRLGRHELPARVCPTGVRRRRDRDDPLGTVSLLAVVHDRHDAAGCSVVDAGRAALRPRRAGDRHGRRERPDGRGQSSRAGVFTIPWTGGPVTSFTRAARGTRPGTRAPRSTGRRAGASPRVVAALEPLEDLDQQLEPVALDRAGARPRRASRR